MKWFFNTTLFLIAIWCVLSGKFDALHLGVGVLGSLFIAASFYSRRSADPFPMIKFLKFIPWHLWQVVLSNIRVAALVLSVSNKINPSFVSENPEIDDIRGLALLGCGITLTPGTLTVDINSDQMLVHSLDDIFAQDIVVGTMARRLQRVFNT